MCGVRVFVCVCVCGGGGASKLKFASRFVLAGLFKMYAISDASIWIPNVVCVRRIHALASVRACVRACVRVSLFVCRPARFNMSRKDGQSVRATRILQDWQRCCCMSTIRSLLGRSVQAPARRRLCAIPTRASNAFVLPSVRG